MQAGISALEARLRSPHIRAEQYAQSIWPSTSDAINVKSSHWYNLLVKPVTSLIFLKDCVSRRYPCSISKLEQKEWSDRMITMIIIFTTNEGRQKELKTLTP